MLEIYEIVTRLKQLKLSNDCNKNVKCSISHKPFICLVFIMLNNTFIVFRT